MPRPLPTAFRLLRWIAVGYVVLAVLGGAGTLLLGSVTSPFGSAARNDTADSDFTEDVADSWNRFNAGAAQTAPVWTADEFLAAVGPATPGRVVTMPGARTVLDTDAVEKALAGSKVLVVVTPPSPLGAVETTRRRDNSMQKFWATPKGLQLVVVHGQEVYLPGPDIYRIATPASGLPLREAMRTGDATEVVLSVVGTAKDQDTGTDGTPPAGSDATTTAALAVGGRAPTADELAPVVSVLQDASLYAASGVDAPAYDPAWVTGLAGGKPLKIALFPYADPAAEPVDWLGALHARFPDAVVVVMTGKWVEAAGLPAGAAQRFTDAALQTYGVGGIALAAAAPPYAEILDWVAGVYAVSTTAAAQYDRLPTLPDTGFPRWLSWLVLGTALIVAAGIAAASLLPRRRPRAGGVDPQERVRRATRALTSSYLALVTAPRLSPAALAAGPEIDHGLGDAYVELVTLQGDPAAERAWPAIERAWDELDRVAERVDPDLAPSRTLPADLRTPPATPRRARPAKRPPDRAQRRLWRGFAAVVAVGFLASFAVRLLDSATTGEAGATPVTALRTSSVAVDDPATRAAVQRVVADRALMLVVDPGGRKDYSGAADLADAAASAYPDAVVFVLDPDSATEPVVTGRIGDDAHVDGYSDTSLIEDYYTVQATSGDDLVALSRQLTLVYDRLAAEGSVTAAERRTYDPPSPPWGWIAVGLVLAVLVAAALVVLATRAVTARLAEDADVRGEREALSLRLSETAVQLLQADTRGPAGDRVGAFAAEHHALDERVATAPASELPGLRQRAEDLDRRVGSALG